MPSKALKRPSSRQLFFKITRYLSAARKSTAKGKPGSQIDSVSYGNRNIFGRTILAKEQDKTANVAGIPSPLLTDMEHHDSQLALIPGEGPRDVPVTEGLPDQTRVTVNIPSTVP